MATLYCGQDDLDALGLTSDVQASNEITLSLVNKALSHQSAVVEGYLSSRFQPPFSEWGDDVRVACATLVVWQLLSPKIGPENPQYQYWLQQYTQKIQWLTDVAKGRSRPVGLVSTDASARLDAGPSITVASDEPTVWPWP